MSIYDADSAGKCKFINPVNELEKLVDEAEKLADEGVLNQGEANALNSKLGAALKSLEMGNTETACNQLQAFINQVNAFIFSAILTEEQGQPLINAATNVISQVCE